MVSVSHIQAGPPSSSIIDFIVVRTLIYQLLPRGTGIKDADKTSVVINIERSHVEGTTGADLPRVAWALVKLTRRALGFWVSFTG